MKRTASIRRPRPARLPSRGPGAALVRPALQALVAALLGTPVQARDYQTFDVVGDSISAGVNPECANFGWGHMLFGQAGCGVASSAATLTNLWPGILAYNSAVSGSTAKDWAGARPAYMQTVSNHAPDLVAVFIGGNDGLAYAADGVYSEAERGEFRTNLLAIIAQLRALAPPPEIMMLNYYDLFDGLSSNLPPAYAAFSQVSAAVAVGNQMMRDVAAETGCFYVDIHSSFLHHAYGAELGDAGHLSPDYVRTPLSAFDIHPVTAGHLAIRDAVFATLCDLQEIPKFAAPTGTAAQVVVAWSSGYGQTCRLQRATASTNAYETVAEVPATPPLNVYTASVSEIESSFYRVQTTE